MRLHPFALFWFFAIAAVVGGNGWDWLPSGPGGPPRFSTYSTGFPGARPPAHRSDDPEDQLTPVRISIALA